VRNSLEVKTETIKGEYAVGEEVEMSVTVVNNGADSVELVFKSSQRYDFYIFKGDEEIWRWSADKMFAMVIGTVSAETQ
jgi:hypothetical protein